MKTVFELELHESTYVDKMEVMRVPGGFIYKSKDGHMVFVPRRTKPKAKTLAIPLMDVKLVRKTKKKND